MIAYRATLDVADELARYLCGLLIEERRRRGTRRGRRALRPFKQAVLGLRWFRDRTAIAALARDNEISRATGYRYVDEVIDVLARQAPDLHDTLRDAAAAGDPYVILDGKLFASDRLSEKTLNKHGREIDRWYSGKHHRQGGNVLVLTDHTGFPLWSAPVEPGCIHDITAATGHVPGALYWAASQLGFPTLTDGGFQGAGIGIRPRARGATGNSPSVPCGNRFGRCRWLSDVAGVAERVAAGLGEVGQPVWAVADRYAGEQPAVGGVENVDLGVVAPGQPQLPSVG